MPGVRFCRSIVLESGCPESLEQVGTSEEERRLAATTFGLLGMLRCFDVFDANKIPDLPLSIAFYLIEIDIMVAELFKNEMCQLVLGHPVHAS